MSGDQRRRGRDPREDLGKEGSRPGVEGASLQSVRLGQEAGEAEWERERERVEWMHPDTTK